MDYAVFGACRIYGSFRYDYRQCRRSRYRRQPRCGNHSGDVGHYFFCCGKRRFRAVNGLFGKTYRRGQIVYRRRCRFRHHIVAVRHRAQPSGFGNFPHLAGLYRRAADSPVAKPVNGILSARKTDAGTGIVGNDRRCRPCSRADTRRLDFRKLALGLDFLH